tara:strand:+ start:181 stop:1200 length:1020 start_codon:yes stop_codon:yes gene_type:complete
MKILSQESNIGIATTVSSATAVRLYNSDSSAGIVTRTDSSNSTIGNFTVPAGEVLYLQKKSTDKLVAPSTVLASKVGYSHMMSYSSYSSGGGGGGDNIVTDNMVVYLDAGNNSSYSGSGTTWNDISGNGNNFTLVNGPTYSSSDGGAIVLDGTNDYAISDINASFFAFGTANDYSYGVWAKIDQAGSNESLLSCGTLTGGVTPNSFQIDFEGVSTRIRHLFRYSSANQINQIVTSGDGIVGTTNWFYVMGVNDRSEDQFKIYINGSLVHTENNSVYRTTDVHNFSSASNTDGTFKIGVNRQLISFVDGRIGQVHVYKGKALTASEVLQNYNASKSRYGL